MAKITKGVLKGLIKECLFEILLEASGESTAHLTENKKKLAPSVKKNAEFSARRVKDAPTNNFDTSTIKSLTDNPVLASIFEDTAKTTLVEQANASGRPSAGNDAASYAVANNDLEDLFGESAAKWASLAYDD
jgi:hypothetical protein